MDWDGLRFTCLLKIREAGWESFQLMLDEQFIAVIYPSVKDANPYMSYSVQGPDNKGHQKNWTIGVPPASKGGSRNYPAECGQEYQIIVYPDDLWHPRRVMWKLWQ